MYQVKSFVWLNSETPHCRSGSPLLPTAAAAMAAEQKTEAAAAAAAPPAAVRKGFTCVTLGIVLLMVRV